MSIQGKRLGLVARPLLSQSGPLVSFTALLFISSPNLVLRCRSLVPTRLTCEPLAPRVRRSLRPKRQTSSLLLLVSFNGFHLVCLSVHPLLFSPRHLCFDDRCLGRGFVLGWRSVLVTFLLAATFLCFENSFPQNRNAAAVTFCLRLCLVCRWPGCTPPSHQSDLLSCLLPYFSHACPTSGHAARSGASRALVLARPLVVRISASPVRRRQAWGACKRPRPEEALVDWPLCLNFPSSFLRWRATRFRTPAAW